MNSRKLRFSWLGFVLAFVIAASVMAVGCGPSLSYNSSALAEAQVGVAYSASVATAEGADDISYELKDGSTLPEGLTFSNGAISGTPTAAVSEKAFTVVATSGDLKAEAEFKLTVKAAAFAYVGEEVSVVINTEANLSLATATGATTVTYTLKSGTLPEGLTFDNGVITGKATALGSATVVVTATATGLTPIDATWTIKVTKPVITYANVTAANGNVGAYYTALLATAKGASDITYAVEEGSELPAGLTLETDGLLHGKPTANGSKTFNVVASADGYESATATVTLRIRAAQEPDPGEGKLSYTGGKLDDGMEGIRYAKLESGTGVAVASTDNYGLVTYALASGSTLPAGLTLYENGALYGFPEKVGSYSFSVTATGDGCTESKTVEFTLKVLEPRLPIEAVVELKQATVGTPYSESIAPADAAMEITFTAKTALPAGLTLDPDGTLHGTPTASYRSITFTAEGTAEGFSPATCEVAMVVKDKEIEIDGGKMEAEYIDLTGKVGAGYSGAANDEQMVQPGAVLNASNNYYIGYTHCVIVLEFKFISSKAASNVKINIGLASELGNVTFTPNEFDVMLNGQAISYGKFEIRGGASEGSWGNFADFTVTNSAALVEGENTITLMVKPNTFLKGQSTGGPGIDYVKVTTDATLRWTPCLYNTRGR